MSHDRLRHRCCAAANRGWRSSCACVIVGALLCAMCCTGCRSLGKKGPVPENVAEARLLAQQGLSAIQRGDYGEAESALGAAVKVCPTEVDARRQYAEVMWRRGEYEIAIEHLKQATQCAPDDLALVVRLGEMQLEAGRTDPAKELANRALDRDPSLVDAWRLRGKASLAAGSPEDALADFHRALENAPKDRDLLFQTADVYRRLNRPQRALSTLITLKETYAPGEEPQSVLFWQALAYSALGRPDQAVAELSLALDRGPPNTELLYRLSEAHLAAGRRIEAQQAVEQALALDPLHGPSLALRDQVQVASRPLETVMP